MWDVTNTADETKQNGTPLTPTSHLLHTSGVKGHALLLTGLRRHTFLRVQFLRLCERLEETTPLVLQRV